MHEQGKGRTPQEEGTACTKVLKWEEECHIPGTQRSPVWSAREKSTWNELGEPEGLVHTSHCRPCYGLLLSTAGTIPQRYVIRSKSLKEKVLQLLCGNSMFGVWGSKNKGGKNSGKGSENSATAPRRVDWTQMVTMEMGNLGDIWRYVWDIYILLLEVETTELVNR